MILARAKGAARRFIRRKVADDEDSVQEGVAYLCHLSIERASVSEFAPLTPDDLMVAFDPSRAAERRGYLLRQVTPPPHQEVREDERPIRRDTVTVN